jgi:hypothetical protein
MVSSEALQRVAERMAADPAFRRAIVTDPAVLAEYDLTEAEKRSLLPDDGDPESGLTDAPDSSTSE